MNRADQAPEPSMEELLASIRLIISDADRNGLPHREPIHPGAPATEEANAGNTGMAAQSEEVFDLTDELVFPGGQAASLSPGPNGRRGFAPADEEVSAFELHGAPRRAAPSNALSVPNAAPPPARLERQQQPAPSVTRPIWSGRELTPRAAPSQLAAPRAREEGIAARPQARNWATDIQLPVPEEGPVSLFSPQGTVREPAAEAASSVEARFDGAAGGDGGTVAVAALAQRLARSAIGVLKASELESAKQVDFEQLDTDSRAEVSERFANAIERESATPGAGQLAGQLDNATVQVREQEPPQSAPAQSLMFESAARPEAKHPPEQDANPDFTAEQQAAAPQRPSQLAAAAQISTRQEPAAPPVAQPLAQAQFVGPAHAPVPVQTGNPLEDAVREMLRPLLVQWLNENMPRILETAIRDEIALRGLLPKSDG